MIKKKKKAEKGKVKNFYFLLSRPEKNFFSRLGKEFVYGSSAEREKERGWNGKNYIKAV